MFVQRLFTGLRSVTTHMNGYNFTEGVRHALREAREQAMALHHAYVGTEHVLLGTILADDVTTRALFDRLQIDRSEVVRAVLAAVKAASAEPSQGQSAAPDLPYTSRAKRVLELAMSEAREQLQTYVGTHHLVAGLVREEKGLAAKVLRDFGISIEAIRAHTAAASAQDASRSQGQPVDAPVAAAHGVEGVIVLLEKAGGQLVSHRFPGPEEAATYLRVLSAEGGDTRP